MRARGKDNASYVSIAYNACILFTHFNMDLILIIKDVLLLILL